MVSVVNALPQSSVNAAISADTLTLLTVGIPPDGRQVIGRALAWLTGLYGSSTLGTGEPTVDHALGMAMITASLNLDLDTRLAALLFAIADHYDESQWREKLNAEFGETPARLVDGLHRLKGLRLLMRPKIGATGDVRAQTETLRKMMLAMVEDIRVVLLRLASRVQSLRYFTDHPGPQREDVAHESMEIYAPLANRLGVWQLKWELEDLSFRFIEPEVYKRIARMLDEKRVEREQFIVDAIARLKNELAMAGIVAEVYGRPKHIYSIRNKMHGKDLGFAEVYDVRALRVLVGEVNECYAALGLVHHLWQPINGEFDDYISHPKGNYYRSLHTAVTAEDGRPFEVQIRTHEMHRHAELGVAAHWRYKESGSQSKSATRADSAYDDKIAWLRQLLSWRDEITDSAEWVQQFKRAALDDTIYLLTPQGRVIDLARGATPIDFAYRVHTDLGHRCRGARVNGQLVPLNTPLSNGQRVEIVSAKQGGPSRDWLNVSQGYLATNRARQKVKQWFAVQEEAETLTQGRSLIGRELQRLGHTQVNIDELAHKLGYKNGDDMYLAGGRGELGMRQIQVVLRGVAEPLPADPEIHTKRSKACDTDSRILVDGVGKILTQLGRCCKPVPPDPISGFVTRGKGVSIHRAECRSFKSMAAQNPERVIGAEWGNVAEGHKNEGLYAVGIALDAQDRQGLLRDISEVLSREKINVTAVKTLSRGGSARMSFTVEMNGLVQLQRILKLVKEVPDVVDVWRA